MDPNLNFKKHVKKKKKTKTIKYNLANWNYLSKIFMHAMILSHTSYCITCWGQAGETVIKPQASLYRQALKIRGKKPIQLPSRWHKEL